MITFNNVTVQYDASHTALRGVNIHIDKGEFVFIVGASGAGKSTFVKILTHELVPKEGSVIVNGQDITRMNEDELNRERIHMGMVFQYSALFDSMSVRENVVFGLRQHGHFSEEEIDSIVREKLHLVGLDGTESLMPASLSGGMKKRVSLARAIALNPEIILYDEPTAGLDPIRSTDISALIKRMKETMHVTSVVVTHDLKSAYYVADRIAFLYKGQFRFIGKPEEIRNSDDPTVQQFIQGRGSLTEDSHTGGDRG